MDELNNIKKTASNMAAGRLAALSKSSRFKVNQTTLREELETACMYGELSGLERILIFLQENKGIPQDELEGVLHMSIVAINNHIASKVGRKDAKIKLEDYLNLRGYYESGKSINSVKLEELRQ